jgi:hypothetical protein
MKHLAGLICFFIFFIGQLEAQLVAKVNPAGLAFGLGSGSLEGFVSNRFSLQLDGYIIPSSERGGLDFSGGGVGVSGRFYATSSPRPTGLFASPFVAQQWVSFNDIRSIAHSYNITALGGQVGYQLTIKKIVTIEAAAGIWTGLNVPNIKQAFGVKEYYGEGASFWLNVGAGFVLWSK